MAKRTRSSTAGAETGADTTVFELRYFPLLAKGLGPALVLEHSQLNWRGNRDLPFAISDHWAALKPTTPFGQLPLLSAPSTGLVLAQTTAIVNYVGRIAGTEGSTNEAYAVSQMLIAEAEDLYAMMNKFLPTVYKRLSTSDITTSKGTREDYDRFWSVLLPAQLEKLERLFDGPAGEIVCSPSLRQKSVGPQPGFLTGELYLWSMLYQCTLVDEAACWPTVAKEGAAFPAGEEYTRGKLGPWYTCVGIDARTKAVVDGRSSMGELKQYYLHADSSDVCSAGDERGRWG
jgi:hypothetical protein